MLDAATLRHAIARAARDTAAEISSTEPVALPAMAVAMKLRCTTPEVMAVGADHFGTATRVGVGFVAEWSEPLRSFLILRSH